MDVNKELKFTKKNSGRGGQEGMESGGGVLGEQGRGRVGGSEWM